MRKKFFIFCYIRLHKKIILFSLGKILYLKFLYFYQEIAFRMNDQSDMTVLEKFSYSTFSIFYYFFFIFALF